ncbi:hypothetical protein OH77DRAFT_506146 [Trametes cingulata]|nr:hypothetical protein OH77DRAFT_506146 [Trametes cingulata]
MLTAEPMSRLPFARSETPGTFSFVALLHGLFGLSRRHACCPYIALDHVALSVLRIALLSISAAVQGMAAPFMCTYPTLASPNATRSVDRTGGTAVRRNQGTGCEGTGACPSCLRTTIIFIVTKCQGPSDTTSAHSNKATD